MDDQNVFEHIDIIYNGKVYCAKKFKIISKRSKIRQDFIDETLDTVVIIIVLPKIIDFYRMNFLNTVSEII